MPTYNESWNDKTILIVEDNDINFILLRELLDKTALRLIRVTDGQEAIDLCKKNTSIELILMDISLPYVDGVEATKQILQFRSELPIIAVTAGDCRSRCMEAGCVDYIAKPVDEEELKCRLIKFLKN